MAGSDVHDAARELVGSAGAVAVLTGAGISAESGVPTFRGEGGLWRGRSALALATPEAFLRDPAEVWEFYHARFVGLGDVMPNPGHEALAVLESERDSFWLLTQNVDGLHRAAGSRNVFELHGNIRMSRCQTCGLETETMRALDGWSPGDVPRCASCGGLIRPSVVWFGEALPAMALRAADDAIRSCDLMLVVGTSGVVQPAASFGAAAKQRGARLIEVNPEATPISGIADVCLRGPAARELPLLLDPTLRRRLSRYTGAG